MRPADRLRRWRRKLARRGFPLRGCSIHGLGFRVLGFGFRVSGWLSIERLFYVGDSENMGYLVLGS